MSSKRIFVDGTPLQLDRLIGRGGEGEVFSLNGDAARVVKLYTTRDLNLQEAKISAMACYETESRTFPHPRSPEALRAIATRWGSVAGCAAAEAFELVRSIRI